MTDSLLYAVDARGVATVTLNRPDVHNAFDDALILKLTQQLRDAGNDPKVRVVVLAGNGKSFCAGADLGWMKRMAGYSREENIADAGALAELMRTLDTLPKPTVAIVHGAAYAGGLGLVTCCDIAIASEKATFCVSEVNLGLVPAVISPYLIAAIGPRNARRYFVTAEIFTAVQAKEIGLVHEVVAADHLDYQRDVILKAIFNGAPQAQAAAKDLVAAVSQRPVDAALIAETGRRIAEQRASAAGKEGVGAFLEKRQPAWRKETA